MGLLSLIFGHLLVTTKMRVFPTLTHPKLVIDIPVLKCNHMFVSLRKIQILIKDGKHVEKQYCHMEQTEKYNFIFLKNTRFLNLYFINNPRLWDASDTIYNTENKTQRLISCSYYLNIKQEFLARFPS